MLQIYFSIYAIYNICCDIFILWCGEQGLTHNEKQGKKSSDALHPPGFPAIDTFEPESQAGKKEVLVHNS